MSASRRPGRPAILSTSMVLDAAVAVIDATGLEGCTMRAVAERLGSSPTSIYRHVADKDELLALLPDHLLAPTSARVCSTRTARTSLLAVANGLEEVLGAHPHAALLFARPLIGPNMLLAAQHCLGLLSGAGLLPADVTPVEVLRSLVAQVVGAHLTSQSATPVPQRLDAAAPLLGPAAPRSPAATGVRLLLDGLDLR